MAGCEFSEFSYGYCVVEDLIIGKGTGLTAAPIFPSLVQEGQKGYGYDVRLNRPGVPLFLQFKLVQLLTRKNSNEAKKGHFVPPFYRMHLRSASISDQHESLSALEHTGQEVYYVAPLFHTTADLNAAYAAKKVWDLSMRLRPSQIGPLPDDKDHHVTFKGQTWAFYSEDPKRRGHLESSTEITQRLRRRIKERGDVSFEAQIEKLDYALTSVTQRMAGEDSRQGSLDLPTVRARLSPLDRVAYLARTFFDCQLLFVSENS